ncbi:ATP-binding cassette domain-containing protein, partial [Streptomyces aidingensis]|uniref:ATP-binding cassette domain-containing protein n=1 Tax=Streptomyces aidingensis TaxID=910347 RepID=UPI001C31BD12
MYVFFPQLSKRRAADAHPPEVSDSERELFGGPLVYDTSWARYEGTRYQLSLYAMVRRLPGLVRTAVLLAWQADRRATVAVGTAEVGRSAAQALTLLGVNQVLSVLLGEGDLASRLRDVLPLTILLGAAAAFGACCAAASTWASGPLEPKVERLARERYLERAYRVEMAAMEDEDFHRLLESAQHGATSARRMVMHCVSVISALLSLLAAATILTVLHPVLLPMLLLMVLPSAWATLTVARHRYRSFHRWIQHSRGAGMLAGLMIDTDAAPEIRVHGIGPYILRHFRGMSKAQETEQARLARLAGRTSLLASACTGAATLATYFLLGSLLWTGAMALAAAGTAVLAIRSGTGTLDGLVRQINFLNQEALHVADLDRLLKESTDWQIPTGGLPLPERLTEIRLEQVTFHYPRGENEQADDEPALREVSLSIPTTGGVIALVGENGSGKTTLVKLLCGLYQPQHGRVQWAGTSGEPAVTAQEISAAEADRAEIFSRFSIVHQDHFRWPMTARVNATISDASRPVDDQRLARAAADAGVDHYLHELPRGWDTLLSRTFRGGHQLSGGQWQRLGIARSCPETRRCFDGAVIVDL